MTKGKLLEAIMKGVPYPQHITDLDLESRPSAIQFTWRGDRFQVSITDAGVLGMVDQVEDGMLITNNLAILLEACLRRADLDMAAAALRRGQG